MIRTVSILLTVIVAGCASVKQVAEKDGKPLYQAKCRSSTADCHAMAAKQCAGNYQEVQTSQWLVEFNMMFQCK